MFCGVYIKALACAFQCQNGHGPSKMLKGFAFSKAI
jgi:hypothetical protein